MGLSKKCTFQVYLSDEEKSRSVLRNFWEIRAENAVSLFNLCAQCVDLVAFIGSGRKGTWEHPGTVFRHDAIEKYQASERVVMVSLVRMFPVARFDQVRK